MTTSTPNLALVLYNSTTDSAEYFSNFRAVIAGTSLSSNFYKIDTAYGNMQAEIDSIQAGAYLALANLISANYYEATVAGISSYTTGMKIILSLNTASAGTVTLNINSLGIKSVMKINSSGTPVNISGGELMVGKYYFFAYDGTRWIWVDSTSADQIYISGTVGNYIKISSNNTLEDGGLVISKASASDVTTGTDDVKFVTSLAIKNSVNVPNVSPGTLGNVLTSNGSAWTSSALPSPEVTATSTNTLTNKRITARVGSTASSATPTINTDNVDAFSITALATAITSMTTNLSGTPSNYDKLIIRIKDNGTPRTIAWGSSFVAGGVALPTTTVASKILTVGFIYNTDNALNKWCCVASVQEA